MFREVRSEKSRLSREECIELLKQEKRGVLSLQGDEGYPYGLPMNFWYCEEDGHLYFHGGHAGYKAEAVRRCDKVSFCVYDGGVRPQGEWAYRVRSVILFGRIRPVEDFDQAIRVTRCLAARYTSDDRYIEGELSRATPAKLLCLELIPEHMTGRLVVEA